MSIRVIIGDVREKLAELPDESVHCVVTSPPYFGLRDYGTASWEGGDPACNHLAKQPKRGKASYTNGQGQSYASNLQAWGDRDVSTVFGKVCGKCGATRTDKQIGLEPTPAEFVEVMVEVFREVRRVLRKDGTCWINLGDSYNSAPVRGATAEHQKNRERAEAKGYQGHGGWEGRAFRGKQVADLKQKDLLGIPWRVAFALQADGWYLRQDIIWAKPNPMPESVTDRCTKAHEYLFLLSKSARYHYDADAIREPQDTLDPDHPSYRAVVQPGKGCDNTGPRYDAAGDQFGVKHGNAVKVLDPRGRNRRSVWTVATQPFSQAHFATFPPALIEPCIKAGCPKDCCAKCGAPVVREVEMTEEYRALLESGKAWRDDSGKPDALTNRQPKGHPSQVPQKNITTGWSPSCSCDAGLARGVCLDPFGGAGTTGLVADRLQRDAILIELNPEYMTMAKERIIDDAPLFAVLT